MLDLALLHLIVAAATLLSVIAWTGLFGGWLGFHQVLAMTCALTLIVSILVWPRHGDR
jgi:hypothetical protein